MNLKEIKHSFVRFFFGIDSEEDKRKVMDSDESTEMLKEQWEYYEDLRQTQPSPDHQKIYVRLKSFIDSEKPLAPQLSLSARLYKWYSVAATIILLAGIGILIFTDALPFGDEPVTKIVQRTGKAQQLHLKLSDGTELWLNGESELTYPESFTGLDTRSVNLTGEAFFKVKASKSQPFVVNTGNMKVEATGTAFNVMDYQDEPIARTVLMEGKVDITNPERHPSRDFKTSLTNNQMLTYHTEDKTFSKKFVNARQHSSWREGKLIFDNAPLMEVILRLEHWYGIDFHVNENLKKSNRYTMKLENDSIQEVLRILKMTTPMGYKIDGNDIYLTEKE
ncbi:MAG: DUF4974 domain-containing protein [Bacteroidales bacterium]|nr:DUF4974 domain-containing protein [Bacteroidales bacterium]MCF8336869.1 DUF4974 domain-containing protein [Bacteroidales bacterium]